MKPVAGPGGDFGNLGSPVKKIRLSLTRKVECNKLQLCFWRLSNITKLIYEVCLFLSNKLMKGFRKLTFPSRVGHNV